MNKWLRRILKTVAGLIVGIVVLLGGGTLLLNTESVQHKLLKRATEMLAEKLETKVEIDSIALNLFTQKLLLYGIEVEDRQQRKMLEVKKLSADLNLSRMMENDIQVEEAGAEGVSALLLKPSKEEPANFQFIIDAFKKEERGKRKEERGEKKKLNVDISELKLKDIHVKYNESAYELQEAVYHKSKSGKQGLTIDGLQAKWIHVKKKGPVDNSAFVEHLQVKEKDGEQLVSIEGLRYQTDNHMPRKNAGKPKRGYFDVDHFDITSNMEWTVHHAGKDTIIATLNKATASDSITGINIIDLRLKLNANKTTAHLSDIILQQTDTRLNIATIDFILPSKKEGRHLQISTGQIKGRAILRDISRPFAKALKDFTLPLNLSLKMSGTDSTIAFRDIKVTTDDKKLSIAATGDITNLRDKMKLDVRFNVNKMEAKGDIKKRIIDQFTVKKLMMKQLDKLGTITYQGRFDVLWKKIVFQGALGSACGPLDFNFALDGVDKYVIGQASTSDFDLGKVMDMKSLGKIQANAQFKVDISKPRTALMRKKKGGKLPICSVNAKVDDCSYKGIHVRNISAIIESDGAVASGDIKQHGNYRDLSCSFSFTDTEQMHKMKITNPGIKFHKMSEEDKKAKAERKQQKKEAKEKAKVEKKAKEEASNGDQPKKKKSIFDVFKKKK